jgi:uncharacterized protein
MANIIVKKASDEEVIESTRWPIWEKEPSEFDWHYNEEEICYIIEGEAIVKTNDEEFTFKKGNIVIFPKGLSCRWHIKTAIKKHYLFR